MGSCALTRLIRYAQAGRSVARRVVDSIRALGEAFPAADVGASAGLASPSHEDDSTERLLQDADQAMYRAKRAGKGDAHVAECSRESELSERRA